MILHVLKYFSFSILFSFSLCDNSNPLTTLIGDTRSQPNFQNIIHGYIGRYHCDSTSLFAFSVAGALDILIQTVELAHIRKYRAFLLVTNYTKNKRQIYGGVEWPESDILHSYHFLTNRFTPFCSTVFVNGESVQTNIELTDSLLSDKLTRPQLDIFVQYVQRQQALQTAEALYFERFRYLTLTPSSKALSCDASEETCRMQLNRKNIRVAVTPVLGRLTFTNNPDGSLKLASGVYFQMLQAASKLYNFTLRLQTGSRSKGVGSKFPNGTWGGTIGDVLYGDADLAVCLSVSPSRHVAYEFTSSMERFTNTFYIQIPKKGFTWKSIYRPFSTFVWIGVGITIVFIMGIHYAIKHLGSNQLEAKMDIFKILRILLDQDMEFNNWKNSATHVLFSSLMLFSLVMGTAFRSKLTSSLTRPEANVILPRTFNELAFSGFVLYLRFYNAATYHTIITSKEPMYQELGKRMILVNTSEDCITRAILKENSACLDYSSGGDVAVASNATLSVIMSPLLLKSEDNFISWPMIFAFRKGSPITQEFNFIVSQSMASGLHDFWIQQDKERYGRIGSSWLRLQSDSKVRQRLEELAQVSQLSLSINSFYGIGVIFCVGVTLALAFFGFGICSFNAKSIRHFCMTIYAS